MGELSPLQEAWSNLYAGLRKQFGTIPSEIQSEINSVDALINPLEETPAPPALEPEAA